MKSLVDLVVEAKLADRIFNERQLGQILGGSDARRYGLVNRALKDGALIRLKRGAYVLEKRYRSEAIHPFVVTQIFSPGSYISLETALAYHGWIPEAVYTTASVTPGRKTIIDETPNFGRFAFHPLAIYEYQFLTSMRREKFGALTAFIAEPLRALMDLVALRKQNWSGLDWLTEGMRIDEDEFLSLTQQDFSALKSVYKHKAANEFLHSFEVAVLGMKASRGALVK
jgi:hypothetical protein